MASDSPGGAPKKLSTQEILARARAEAANKAGAARPAPAAEPAAPEPPSSATAQSAAPAAKPAAGPKPKSTADILAAARAQSAAKAAAPVAAKGGAAAEGAAASAPETKPKPAAKPAGGPPKSTADILAAARAGKAAGASAAPAAAATTPAAPKPAVAKAVGKVAAEAGVASSGLSVEEMLAAVRPGAVATAGPAAVAVPAAKVAPPMPARPAAKPAAGKGSAAADVGRRGFLGGALALLATPFAIAWTSVAATAGVWTLGLARFMLPNVLTEPPSRFKIGPPTDYDLGTVATKWVAQFGIWIVHTDQYKGRNLIYALASVCTHLGCTPSWLDGERKFKCPCHGSGFYVTGINFEGPAPRPLERVGIRLAEDGMLEVDKSVKFQEEMGQWNDPASFFEVTA